MHDEANGKEPDFPQSVGDVLGKKWIYFMVECPDPVFFLTWILIQVFCWDRIRIR